jgi:hypothetical protein
VKEREEEIASRRFFASGRRPRLRMTLEGVFFLKEGFLKEGLLKEGDLLS